MFGSISAIPSSFKIVNNVVDVYDENGGVQSYRFDGQNWVEHLRPDRPKCKNWLHRH